MRIYSKPIDILQEEYTPDLSTSQIQKKDQALKEHTDVVTDLKKYSVQIASFKDQINAKRYLKDISNRYSTFTFRLHFSDNLWRILSRQMEERFEAEKLLQQLKKNGFSDAWIVQF